MLPPILLPIIEKLLNQYLKLDPEMQQKLQAYDGRVLRFTLSSIDWTFYIKVKQTLLELKSNYDGPIDASLSAAFNDLIKNAVSEKSVSSETLILHGDNRLIQAIIKIFKEVEIDWEALMARYMGDTISHDVFSVLKKVKSFASETMHTQCLNVKEYLQEEIQLLGQPFAIEDFMNDVEQFRDQVDRINARINLLRDRLEKD